jgi:HaeIII restriction endonuclease
MSKISNQYGRALEYAIVERLIQNLSVSQLLLSSRAVKAQTRDFPHYHSLPIDIQTNYQKCANRVFEWLNNDFSITQQTIILDRLPDEASRKGDVTDIKLSLKPCHVNLSIKHNNKAFKHQRPASTAQHLGYPKKSYEDLQFRQEYKTVTQAFITSVREYSYFRDLPDGFILENLYIPICELVTRFINYHGSQAGNAKFLFDFLVGTTDFYKIILSDRQSILVIQEFSQISNITSVDADNHENYISLNFSNSWIIKMRLHSASSRIGNTPSLKFDTQPVHITVPEKLFSL